MKKLQKLDPIDMGYFLFFGIFSLVVFIELIKYLIAEYTFTRACIVFAGVTFLYLARKHIWMTGKSSNTQKTTRKGGILPLTSTGRKRKIVKNKVVSWLSADSFFLAFILYGVFVVAYSL